MTNAEALRALATVMEQDETLPYKALRLADPDVLAIALLRQSADELDRMQASLTARDTDLMRQVQKYKKRWLGTPTPGVTPASEGVTDTSDPDNNPIVPRLWEWARISSQTGRGYAAEAFIDAVHEIERLRALVPSPAEQKQDVPHTPGVASEGEDVTGMLWVWKDGPTYFCYEDEFPTDENGYPLVHGKPIGRAILLSPAEQAQRKLNAEAWERNRALREGSERYDSYEPLPDRLVKP